MPSQTYIDRHHPWALPFVRIKRLESSYPNPSQITIPIPMSSPPETSTPPAIFYSIDPNTNPSTWPGLANTAGTVDVTFININAASDFRLLRTGTNGHVHEAVNQITKHVARGLYRIISMNVSEYCCHVVMATEKPRDELMWKNGFPWDRENDSQPPVVLE